MYKSPLNYTGSKTDLLPQIVPFFPKHIDGAFVDLFCGGLSVTINTNYNRYVCNDIIKPLIDFYREMYSLEYSDFEENCLKYQIDKTSQEQYNNLRELFNKSNDPYQFFGLVSACTNNMMRFNNNFKFNQTFGKRTINSSTLSRLYDYYKELNNKNIIFENSSYEKIVEKYFHESNFFYLDPPYTSTKNFKVEAGYNCYWKNERLMWQLLEKMNTNNIKFCVSNILEKNGVKNPFYDMFKKFDIVNIDKQYDKVARNKTNSVQEILIKNY